MARRLRFSLGVFVPVWASLACYPHTRDVLADGALPAATSGGEGGASPSAIPAEGTSLLTDLDVLTMRDALQISVAVTDPDGIADVIGGQRLTEDGERVLGTFSSTAEEGAYSMSVSCDLLHRV